MHRNEQPMFPQRGMGGLGKIVTVRVPDRSHEVLKELSKATGIGISDLARQALEFWSEKGPHAEEIRAIAKRK